MIVYLSGLLLVFLVPCLSQRVIETVDVNTLAHIITFFEQNYKRGDARQPRQYATAINVNLTQCRASFNLSQNNFLTQEDARIVKNAIDAPNAVYQGQQLIAAGVRNMGKYNYHSEFLLLHPPENSLMTNLLNRNNQDCSVFYTYNSPCFGTCLNEQGPFNILTALDNWSRRGGIKAFVFKDFWRFDTKKDVESKFKLIASRVPLYRCVNDTMCFACNGEGDTPINGNCLPPHPPPIIRHDDEL